MHIFALTLISEVRHEGGQCRGSCQKEVLQERGGQLQEGGGRKASVLQVASTFWQAQSVALIDTCKNCGEQSQTYPATTDGEASQSTSSVNPPGEHFFALNG